MFPCIQGLFFCAWNQIDKEYFFEQNNNYLQTLTFDILELIIKNNVIITCHERSNLIKIRSLFSFPILRLNELWTWTWIGLHRLNKRVKSNIVSDSMKFKTACSLFHLYFILIINVKWTFNIYCFPFNHYPVVLLCWTCWFHANNLLYVL